MCAKLLCSDLSGLFLEGEKSHKALRDGSRGKKSVQGYLANDDANHVKYTAQRKKNVHLLSGK